MDLVTHYSTLGRTTLCGKVIPFKPVCYTSNPADITCTLCRRRYNDRTRYLNTPKAGKP